MVKYGKIYGDQFSHFNKRELLKINVRFTKISSGELKNIITTSYFNQQFSSESNGKYEKTLNFLR